MDDELNVDKSGGNPLKSRKVGIAGATLLALSMLEPSEVASLVAILIAIVGIIGIVSQAITDRNRKNQKAD